MKRGLIVLLVIAGLMLATGCSSSSKRATTSGSDSVASTTGSTAASSGFPGARGCSAPSADAIGSAWGVTITKSTPTADSGCLWEAGSLSQSVQVSYPPLSEFPSVRVNILHSGTVTDITIPGATVAFIKLVLQIGGHTNRVAYVIYPTGVVQVAVGGPDSIVTDSTVLAITKVIVGV